MHIVLKYKFMLLKQINLINLCIIFLNGFEYSMKLGNAKQRQMQFISVVNSTMHDTIILLNNIFQSDITRRHECIVFQIFNLNITIFHPCLTSFITFLLVTFIFRLVLQIQHNVIQTLPLTPLHSKIIMCVFQKSMIPFSILITILKSVFPLKCGGMLLFTTVRFSFNSYFEKGKNS